MNHTVYPACSTEVVTRQPNRKPPIKGGFSVWLGYWGGEARCKLQATSSFLLSRCNLPPSQCEGWVQNPCAPAKQKRLSHLLPMKLPMKLLTQPLFGLAARSGYGLQATVQCSRTRLLRRREEPPAPASGSAAPIKANIYLRNGFLRSWFNRLSICIYFVKIHLNAYRKSPRVIPRFLVCQGYGENDPCGVGDG